MSVLVYNKRSPNTTGFSLMLHVPNGGGLAITLIHAIFILGSKVTAILLFRTSYSKAEGSREGIELLRSLKQEDPHEFKANIHRKIV